MSVATGAHTIWGYIWEDDNEFAQDPGEPTETEADLKIFGADESMDAADRSNNPERLFRPFRRSAEQIIEQAFEGSWGADFVLTNSWWLQFFFGEPEVSGTEAPYTHEYSINPQGMPKSAHLIEEIHWPDGAIEQNIYIGAVAGTVDFDVAVEDTVDVSIDGNYADERNYEDANESPYGVIGEQPATQYRAMHFGNSILRMDLDADGTAEAMSLVQDASLGLEGNLEMAHELGTRFAVAPQYLQYEPSVSYTKLAGIQTKNEEQRSAYGDVAADRPQETMAESDIDGEMEFDAGLDTEENAVTLNIEGAFPEDFSRSNIGDPQEAVEDDIDRMVQLITATVESDQENPA